MGHDESKLNVNLYHELCHRVEGKEYGCMNLALECADMINQFHKLVKLYILLHIYSEHIGYIECFANTAFISKSYWLNHNMIRLIKELLAWLI